MDTQTTVFVMEERLAALKKVRIFSETSDDVLMEIASVVSEEKYKRGQNIFKKGDVGDAMYIINQGSVRVHDGNHVLSRLAKGQVFGEFALFDKEARSASITADESTTLFKLDQDDFYHVMAGKAEVTKGVLIKVIRRIREMNELEGKLAKSYLKIQKQKNEIEEIHQNILEQKAELEKTNDQLLRLNDEKNQLIGIVSHGLRNPLTSSLCVMDLLEQECENCTDEQKEYIQVIHKSLRRMNSLINQTLDIDIIELQREKLKLENVNLAEVLKLIEEGFKYTLSLKKLDLDLKVEDLFAKVDKNFVYIIFDNLLSNAIKFSPVKTKITIDLFESDGKIITEISDEGPGISDEALKTLFDKPQVHDRQTDKTGLSIAKKYVKAMNGKLDCKSKFGQGTTFIVKFDKI